MERSQLPAEGTNLRASSVPEEEFVTVAEAARALGVDARQVRRWVDRLEPKDKGQDTQRTHKGQPIVTVRLSAVEALQKGDSRGEGPKDTHKGQARDTAPRPVRVADGVSLELAEALQRAAVAEARAELLDRELTDWKRQAETLGESLKLAQEEARAARLVPARSVQQIAPAGLAGDTQSGAGASDGSLPTPEPRTGAPGGFWARLWKGGR